MEDRLSVHCERNQGQLFDFVIFPRVFTYDCNTDSSAVEHHMGVISSNMYEFMEKLEPRGAHSPFHHQVNIRWWKLDVKVYFAMPMACRVLSTAL